MDFSQSESEDDNTAGMKEALSNAQILQNDLEPNLLLKAVSFA